MKDRATIQDKRGNGLVFDSVTPSFMAGWGDHWTLQLLNILFM